MILKIVLLLIILFMVLDTNKVEPKVVSKVHYAVNVSKEPETVPMPFRPYRKPYEYETSIDSDYNQINPGTRIGGVFMHQSPESWPDVDYVGAEALNVPSRGPDFAPHL